MDSERVRATTTHAAERRARHTAAIGSLGFALLVVFLVSSFQGAPRPSVHGRGLALVLALVGFAAAVLRILRLRDRPAISGSMVRQTLGLLAGASICLVVAVRVQRHLPVQLGLALVVYTAGARLPLLLGATVTALVTVAVDVALAATGQPFAYVTANTLLAALLFLVALLVVRARAEQERAELLSAELADSVELRERAARVEERSRIARDLHDVLAHSLSALSIQLEAARMLAKRGTDGELTRALDRASALARSGTDDSRLAVAALRGDAVPGSHQLQRLVEDFSTDTGITTQLAVAGEPSTLSPDAGTALYRACQEALTNVARYSGASHAEVRLALDADVAMLTVSDHHDPRQPRRPLLAGAGSGHGLNAMHERIALLGGTLDAGPTKDGWKVEVRLPR